MLCLGVFIAFLVMMFSFTAYGFAEGDVSKYLAPVNGNNEICGYDTQTGKPKLNFPTLVGSIFDDAECVATCPATTRDVLNYCIPKFSGKEESQEAKEFTAAFQMMLQSNAAGRQLLDIYKSSTAVFIACGMAVIFCFAYIYLMSFFAEQIAWTIIGITQIGLFVASAFATFEYFEIRSNGNLNKVDKEKAWVYLAAGIVLAIVGLLMVCAIVCGFN